MKADYKLPTEIANFVKGKVTKVENLNTNNSWGFGGATKSVYTLDNDAEIHVGKAYYRHTPPENFINLRKTDEDFYKLEGKTMVLNKLKELYPDS